MSLVVIALPNKTGKQCHMPFPPGGRPATGPAHTFEDIGKVGGEWSIGRVIYDYEGKAELIDPDPQPLPRLLMCVCRDWISPLGPTVRGESGAQERHAAYSPKSRFKKLLHLQLESARNESTTSFIEGHFQPITLENARQFKTFMCFFLG